MGLLVPAPRGAGMEFNFSGRPSTSWGTLLTASATPHSEGALSEIIASTARSTNWIRIHIGGTSTSATLTDGLVNIYIGSTHLLIPNLLAGWAPAFISGGTALSKGRVWEFPLYIPRGSQIQGSLRALIASDTCRVAVMLEHRNHQHWTGAMVESVGAVTASSKGTSVTPGTTSEGSFATLGTTVNPFRFVAAGHMGNADVTNVSSAFGLDLGTGGAVIAGLENFLEHGDASENQQDISVPGRFIEVAAGTSLQARLQSHTTDAEAKTVIAYGVY